MISSLGTIDIVELMMSVGVGGAVTPMYWSRKPDGQPVIPELACRVEEAKLLWAQRQPEMALRLAGGVLRQGREERTDPLQLAQLMTLVGKWQSIRRSVLTLGSMTDYCI